MQKSVFGGKRYYYTLNGIQPVFQTDIESEVENGKMEWDSEREEYAEKEQQDNGILKRKPLVNSSGRSLSLLKV